MSKPVETHTTVREAFHKSIDCKDCALSLRDLAMECRDGNILHKAADLLLEYARLLESAEVTI